MYVHRLNYAAIFSYLQLVGLGKLRPNTVLLGYKANWRKCDRQELKAYFNTLQ